MLQYRINSMIIYRFIQVITMSTKRKTISVTEHQNKWIKAQIESGNYTNDSEYIRDLIRRDQARQIDLEAVRAALIEGEKSGDSKPFNIDDFKKEMQLKHG